MINKITDIVPSPPKDLIFNLLPHLKPKLCVDIGAAAGFVSKRLMEEVHPSEGVVAFEPFPNNWPYFEKNTSGYPNVRLIKKAVSDRVGVSRFVVSSVVQGNEKNWEQLPGYSSTGHLEEAAPSNLTGTRIEKKVRSLAKVFLNKYVRKKGAQSLLVKTTTLDREFPSERLDFIKMDVQGSEALVLKGAQGLLKEGRIGLMYLEWDGDQEVLDILHGNEFLLYDSHYLLGNPRPRHGIYEEMGFEIIGETFLSTGKKALEMVLRNGEPVWAVREIKRRNLGWIQTDLMAVHRSVEGVFRTALKKLTSP
ncbi:MAG: FkbM family methyltransferase [Bacteroidetes bacterium]|nr:MAG: FkbM family methyltransferase [Bacteroidota bacterium]